MLWIHCIFAQWQWQWRPIIIIINKVTRIRSDNANMTWIQLCKTLNSIIWVVGMQFFQCISSIRSWQYAAWPQITCTAMFAARKTNFHLYLIDYAWIPPPPFVASTRTSQYHPRLSPLRDILHSNIYNEFK